MQKSMPVPETSRHNSPAGGTIALGPCMKCRVDRDWREGERTGQRSLQGLGAAGLQWPQEGIGPSSCSDGETWKVFSRGRTWLALLSTEIWLLCGGGQAGRLLWRLLKYSRGGGQPRAGLGAWHVWVAEMSGRQNCQIAAAELKKGARVMWFLPQSPSSANPFRSQAGCPHL